MVMITKAVQLRAVKRPRAIREVKSPFFLGVRMLLSVLLFTSISYSMVIDKDLRPYYDKFYTECLRYRNNCPHANLRFDPLMKYKFQLSGFGDRINNTAWINRSAFEQSSDAYREMLIFHELAHVALMKEHCYKEDSIMNKFLLDENFYRFNRTKLLKDLFKGDCK